MNPIRIAVTCIGSGVAQSIIDSIKLSNLDIYTIGLGSTPYAFAAYDCDENILLPTVYNNNYIDQLFSACINANVDILLPGHDDELLLLSDHLQTFETAGIHIPISHRALLELCRDKGRMSTQLNTGTPYYVNSYSKNQLLNSKTNEPNIFPLIAKPNAGFASRGLSVVRSLDDVIALDGDMVFQEIAYPHPDSPEYGKFVSALNKNQVLQLDELSLQVVIGRHGNELGRFASCNRLHNGVPIEIVPVDAPAAWTAIDELLPTLIDLGLRGPLNLQGRLTEHGLKLFEMNARFTGITGLRAMCGFNEVEALIYDTLELSVPPRHLAQNHRKIGIRQYKNRVVDFKHTTILESAVRQVAGFPADHGQTVLVTGANSYLGRATIDALLDNPDVSRVIGLARDIDRFNGIDSPELPAGADIYPISAYYDGTLNFGDIDIVCHLASSRPVHSQQEIANSLAFSQQLIRSAHQHHTPRFIYASSQSVYGTKQPPLWRESQAPAPESAYAMAKYSTELMLEQIQALNPSCQTTSLRISRLFGPSPVFRLDELPHKFVASALNQKPLTVMGGEQTMDFIDVRDAATVISTLVSTPHRQWQPVLNVSAGQPISILDLAKQALEVAGHNTGFEHWINQDLSFQAPNFGLDISLLSETLNWRPTYDIRATLNAIFQQLRQAGS